MEAWPSRTCTIFSGNSMQLFLQAIPAPDLPCRHGAIVLGPLFGSDMRVAAVVRSFFRSPERVFDVDLPNRRSVASAGAVNKHLEIWRRIALDPFGIGVVVVAIVAHGTPG
jgi:hypothetical protein